MVAQQTVHVLGLTGLPLAIQHSGQFQDKQNNSVFLQYMISKLNQKSRESTVDLSHSMAC